MPHIVEKTIKKNVATSFYVALQSQTGVVALQANPTLAAGDAKHTGDGSALANLGTLPAVEPAGSRNVKVTLAQAETNYDNISIIFADAAGAEWHDLIVCIRTTAVTVDDLVRSATPANPAAIDASGRMDVGKWLGTAVTTDASTSLPDVHVDAIGSSTAKASSLATAISTSTNLVSVDVSRISGDATAADNLEAATDGNGYAFTGCSIPAVLSVSALANGAITAAAVATGAIDADALASDAVAKIADGVWDEARAGHVSAGSFGEYVLANVTLISGDSVAADNAEAAFDGNGYSFTACTMPATTAVTNPVNINLSQSFTEGQTALTVGSAFELTHAYHRYPIEVSGGNLTQYRSDGTTPIVTRTKTDTRIG